jgi:hypothetical protein
LELPVSTWFVSHFVSHFSNDADKMKDADGPQLWYWPGMRRNCKSITTSPEIITNIADLSKMNFNLLTKLVPWLDANEKAQRKFRTAVLIRLSKIETVLTEVQGAQLADFWAPERVPDEQRAKYLQEVEERVSRETERLVLKMVRYIYGETEMPERRHDRRRKWWGWEI